MNDLHTAPPFRPEDYRKPVHYYWWSWHPLYPRWSKSCWGGPDEQTARKRLTDPACGLDLYHNKLIKEDNGIFEEIADVPCEKTYMWEKYLSK